MGAGGSLSTFKAAGQTNRSSIFPEEKSKKDSKMEDEAEDTAPPAEKPKPKARVLVA